MMRGHAGTQSKFLVWGIGILFVAAAGAAGTGLSARTNPDLPAGDGSVQGRFLVANPDMPDPRFARTVILMVRHDESGALGLVINKPIGYAQVTEEDALSENDENVEGRPRLRLRMPAFYGGPVHPGRAFIVHSPEYRTNGTVGVTAHVAVSTHRQILDDIADGKGPKQVLYVVGYTGWGPGQLEKEMRRDDWYLSPVEASMVFGDVKEDPLWQRALESRLRGI